LYPAVPPFALTDAEPLVPPKHKALDGVLPVVKTVGCVIAAEVVAVQPFTSVTVTVYVPVASPEISSMAALFDHEKADVAYEGEPGVTERFTEPFVRPKQVIFVGVADKEDVKLGRVITT
jgi:hypothetical protein